MTTARSRIFSDIQQIVMIPCSDGQLEVQLCRSVLCHSRNYECGSRFSELTTIFQFFKIEETDTLPVPTSDTDDTEV